VEVSCPNVGYVCYKNNKYSKLNQKEAAGENISILTASG